MTATDLFGSPIVAAPPLTGGPLPDVWPPADDGPGVSWVGSLSGGLGSWAACKLAAGVVGDRLSLVFADTLIENADLYRFLLEGAANIIGIDPPRDLMAAAGNLPGISRAEMPRRKADLARLRASAAAVFGGRLVWLADGRTPFEVFRDVRFLGNSRVDPCSKILKRQLIDRWMDSYHPRPTTRSVVGLGWYERHRFEGQWQHRVRDGRHVREWKPGLRERMAERGWRFHAPLVYARPTLDRADLRAWAEREGLGVSEAYDRGFEHDNCSNGCVKAGQGHWLKLLTLKPDTFEVWEVEESDLRAELGDVAMLTEKRAGGTFPLPLAEFRRRVEMREEVCVTGGAPCGCFFGPDE